MSGPTITLVGYEAIGCARTEVAWFIVPGAQLRVYVSGLGRRATPDLVVSAAGDSRRIVLESVDPGSACFEMRLGADFEVGDAMLRIGDRTVRWPLRRIEPLGVDVDRVDVVPERRAIHLRFRQARERFFASDHRKAANYYRATSDLAASRGLDSWAARALRAAAHQYSQYLGGSTTARDLLSQADTLTPPEDITGRLLLDYERAMLANTEGRSALAEVLLRDVLDKATVWRLERIAAGARAGLSTVPGADLPPLRAGADTAPQLTPERVNRAWMHAAEAWRCGVPGDLADVDRALAQAVDGAPADTEPALLVQALLNLAWIARLLGRSREGHRRLDGARTLLSVSADRGVQSCEAGILAGWLKLDAGDKSGAVAAFEGVCASVVSPEQRAIPFVWSAWHGLGRALMAIGDVAEGLACLQNAAARLEWLVVGMSATQRGGIFTRRTPLADPIALADDTAEAWRRLGRPQAGFAIIDAANARCRVFAKSGSDRKPGSDHSGGVEADAGREALQSRMVALDAASSDVRRARRMSDEARTRALAAFGRRLRFTWESLLDREFGRSGEYSEGVQIEQAQAWLEADCRLLLDWRRSDGRREVWSVGAATTERHIEPTPDVLLGALRGAAHVYVICGPNAPSWYTLPGLLVEGGPPLAATVGISFLTSAELLRPRAARPAAETVIVADPLCNLRYAEQDGEWLVSRLGGRLLAGDAASLPAVMEAAGRSRLLHFSGHGQPAAGTWDGAELRLTGGDVLRAEHVLSDGAGPEGVVLNGCETGGRFVEQPLSLPSAFLAAGSRWVLATVRPVPDDEASAFVRHFYRAGGATAPGEALRVACERVIEAGSDVWSAYRLVGLRKGREK